MLPQSGWLCLLVWCKARHHQAPADLPALVDTGRGDVPLVHLRFRCTERGIAGLTPGNGERAVATEVGERLHGLGKRPHLGLYCTVTSTACGARSSL
jgi:hypothetical protein